jgi:hypothetical protein
MGRVVYQASVRVELAGHDEDNQQPNGIVPRNSLVVFEHMGQGCNLDEVACMTLDVIVRQVRNHTVQAGQAVQAVQAVQAEEEAPQPAIAPQPGLPRQPGAQGRLLTVSRLAQRGRLDTDRDQ